MKFIEGVQTGIITLWGDILQVGFNTVNLDEINKVMGIEKIRKENLELSFA